MTSVNKKEIEKFSKMAEEWWDLNGKFKPLHKFNPIRIRYIKDNIINHFNLKDKNKPLNKINILDIGTGSGCILLSLLSELKKAKGTGVDISSKAIITAISNAKKMKLLDRSRFKVFNFENFYSTKYDLIVSNPPYIPFKDIKNLSKDIKNYEPLVALNGGNDGLDIIKKIIYKSDYLLKRNGTLAIEIGYNQYSKVNKLLKYNGYREVSKEFDCNNNVRCIITTKM